MSISSVLFKKHICFKKTDSSTFALLIIPLYIMLGMYTCSLYYIQNHTTNNFVDAVAELHFIRDSKNNPEFNQYFALIESQSETKCSDIKRLVEANIDTTYYTELKDSLKKSTDVILIYLMVFSVGYIVLTLIYLQALKRKRTKLSTAAN